MKKVPFLLILLLMTASLAGCLGNDDSDDEASEPTTDETLETAEISLLFTQTVESATSNNNTLTLETQDDVFAFTDRPNRMAGHIPLENFTTLWSHNNSTFTEDPPNAVITWKADNGSMAYAEIILTNASVNVDGFIEYNYTLETGETIPSNLSEVSLFIDTLPEVPTWVECFDYWMTGVVTDVLSAGEAGIWDDKWYHEACEGSNS